VNARLAPLCLAVLVLFSSAPQAVRAASPVRVYTAPLTLRAYDWRSALIPTSPDDPIFPYPRLDFDRVGGPNEITTTVVILESANTRLTIAPEFGGRLLRWFDKRAQRDVLYVNPVLKPTHWGYRGWWFASGGMEWAFPTNEHGLNEWRPWEYRIASGSDRASVTVSDHEDRTGLDVAVTVTLYANDYVAITPRVTNRTGTPQQFQFWINAMLPYSDASRFWLPARQVEVHSTGDDTLPAPGEKMSWPIYQQRDFSYASEWQRYLGVFAAPTLGGFAAVSNPHSQTRLMRIFPASLARGVKLFSLGDLPSDLYTDGDSRYLELWGGFTRTFDEEAVLQPGRIVTWTEYWTTR
jgi:Domain of unknown function (DUF5107)